MGVAVVVLVVLLASASHAGGPAVTMTPDPLVFGDQHTGTSSPERFLTVLNSGDAPLDLPPDYASVGASTQFIVSPHHPVPAVVLAPGESALVSVVFYPAGAGESTATLEVRDSAGKTVASAQLKGMGTDSPTPAPVTLAPPLIDFGDVSVNASVTDEVSITNEGQAPATILAVSLNSPDSKDFALTGAKKCEGKTINPGDPPCTFLLSVTATRTGRLTAVLAVRDNVSTNPREVPVSAFAHGGGPIANVRPPELTFVQSFGANATSRSTQTVTVRNAGEGLLRVARVDVVVRGGETPEFNVDAGNCLYKDIPLGGSCKMKVFFTPEYGFSDNQNELHHHPYDSRSATLRVVDNAKNGQPPGQQSVGLIGMIPAVAAKLDPIPKSQLAKDFKEVKGTAGAPGSTGKSRRALAATTSRRVRVRRVEIALLRVLGGARAARHAGARCLWLTAAPSRFRAIAPHRGRCDTPLWLRASGTSSWRYVFKRLLPRGTYILYARATDQAGLTQDVFSLHAHNRVTFRLT